MNINGNKEKEKLANDILKYLKSGDVVNTSGKAPFWKFWLNIAYWGIRKAQKSLFLKDKPVCGLSPNMDTHCTIFFAKEDINKFIQKNNPPQKFKDIFKKNPDAQVFSVELPKATFVPLQDECGADLTVLRYTKKTLTEEDIFYMLEGAVPIVGTKYDIGQLIDIAINQIAGYPNAPVVNLFDAGSSRKVCSVGVAAVYTYWRHKLEKKGINIPRIFSKINQDPSMWGEKDFVKKFNEIKRWDVESTYPANFSNSSTHFDGEFKVVLKIVDNKITVFENN